MRPNKENQGKFYGLESNKTYSFISTNPGQQTPFDAKFIGASSDSIRLEIDNNIIDYPTGSINVQEDIPRARLVNVNDENPDIKIVIAKKIGGSLKKRRSLKRKRVRKSRRF